MSAIEPGCCRWISPLVMTLAPAIASTTDCSVLVGVTVIVSRLTSAPVCVVAFAEFAPAWP
jgi:hypothetical protein